MAYSVELVEELHEILLQLERDLFTLEERRAGRVAVRRRRWKQKGRKRTERLSVLGTQTDRNIKYKGQKLTE